MREHRVGRELGELRGPQTDSENLVLLDPVRVDGGEGRAGRETRVGLEGADEDSVRVEEVGDGGALGEEF